MQVKKQYINRIIVPAALLFLLSSCFVAREYERPETDTEGLYRLDTSLSAGDTLSAADKSWEQVFTDPVLQEHIRTALSGNNNLLSAFQRVEEAEAYYRQGRAGYLPSVNLNGSMTHQELAKNSQFGSIFSGSIQQYQLTADLAWEADIWGKIRSNKRAAYAGFLQAGALAKGAQTELVAAVAATYYQLLALDAQLAVADETTANRRESLETIKALKEAGNVTEVAVKQTEAQLYTAQLLALDLRNQTRMLENTMSILLGRSPATVKRGELEGQEVAIEPTTGIPALLLNRRPDVMAAEFGLVNAFEMENVARSYFYPSFTLTASGGFQSIELDQFISANSLFATVIGGVAQPLLNGRQNRTRMEVAKAQKQQALLGFKQTLLEAGKEVSDALYTYNTESEKLKIRLQELEALRAASEYSEELLNNGLANYLEVLTAQSQALNAEIGTVDARFQRLNALVTLYKALGGGVR